MLSLETGLDPPDPRQKMPTESEWCSTGMHPHNDCPKGRGAPLYHLTGFSGVRASGPGIASTGASRDDRNDADWEHSGCSQGQAAGRAPATSPYYVDDLAYHDRSPTKASVGEVESTYYSRLHTAKRTLEYSCQGLFLVWTRPEIDNPDGGLARTL